MPPNLYDLIQEMGRVDRQLIGGDFVYFVYIDVPSYIELFVRCMKGGTSSVRSRHLRQLQEVLEFLGVNGFLSIFGWWFLGVKMSDFNTAK